MRGKLIFIKHYSWIGNRIRKLTKCDYNHVGIFVDNNTIVEATMDKGVKKTSYQDYMIKYLEGKIDYRLYTFHESITDAQIEKMVSLIEKQIGSKYDFLQLITLGIYLALGINLKIEPIDLRHKWICSELIGETAYDAGIKFSETVDPDNLSPADLFNSKIIERVI